MTNNDSQENADTSGRNYWWLNANPNEWEFSSISVGDVQTFDSVTNEGSWRPYHGNFFEVKTGDIVIAYQSTPRGERKSTSRKKPLSKQIVALCEILGEHDDVTKKILVVKIKDLEKPVPLGSLKKYLEDHPELVDEEQPFRRDPEGNVSPKIATLLKLTKRGYNLLWDLIRKQGNEEPSADPELERKKEEHLQEWLKLKEEHQRDPEKYRRGQIMQPSRKPDRHQHSQGNQHNQDTNENPLQTPTIDGTSYEKYGEADFCNEVFMGKDQYDTLVRLLKNKKNIILQGPPGVGKTYAAKRLAWSILKEKSDNHPQIQFVQFHQSYSYEDFVEGYKPREGGDGFERKSGVFREFCDKAQKDSSNDYFLVIDEINRGNTSKIFGELLMLIENDHRGETTKLAYSREKFSVPENLFIIGMMNTADRNLAMLDYALRRRFGFFEMEPAFDSEGFGKYQDGLEDPTFEKLIAKVKELNEEIERDDALGEGFRIGHSYFCGWDKHEDYLKNKDDPTELKTILEGKMQDVVECDILPTLKEYWFENKEVFKKWETELRNVIS